MRSIITVVGRDTVGILAKVSALCAEHRVNIIEVSQSILQDMFCMIMLVDVSKSSIPFSELSDYLENAGKQENLIIHSMHEDIFNEMHRI